MKSPLHVLLVLLIAVPPLAVIWHQDGSGQILFVLYRQPKLAAIAVLGWLFVAMFMWRHGWRRVPLSGAEAPARGRAGNQDRRRPSQSRPSQSRPSQSRRSHGPSVPPDNPRLSWNRLRAVSTWPGALGLLAFLVYMASTGLWVQVAANYRYELRQYVLLALLTICLGLWLRRDVGARSQGQLALTLSLALVAAVGCLQAVLPLPWLSPINPDIGAVNPSFMGYKNPMALALLGQLFLVVSYAETGHRRVFWRLVLVLELVYLATLGSRTSYFALAVAASYWLALTVRRRVVAGKDHRVGRHRRILTVAGGLALLMMVFAWHPVARQKITSVAAYVASPSGYLDSDRGIYLRNTLHMVTHRPWGVGLGDWQTHYPVYRLHGRDVAFDDRFQVRRAHSDHVQFLGEGGWPGALLWGAFVLSLLVAAHRRAWRRGDAESTAWAAQWVALFVAMGSDYLLELPYNKFQFFVLLALFWSSRGESVGDPPESLGETSEFRTGGRRLRGVLVAVAVVAMVSSVFHYSQLVRRSQAAAAIAQPYSLWAAGQSAAWPEVLRQVDRHQRTLRFAAGETKTMHKDFVMLSHIAMAAEQRPRALADVRRALRHHPYYSPAFRLMAELAEDGETTAAWRAGYDFLMHHAVDGWQGPYPASPPHHPADVP